MKNPFEFFDKIYCINLKERTDRWEECLSEFEKYGIENVERIEAIKVKEESLSSKRIGQIGCSLSYAVCVNKSLLAKADNVLILEDDFDFIFDKEKLYYKMNKALNGLPEDWDSLYFGGTVVDEYGHAPLQSFSDKLFKLKCAHTTHSIAFSKRGLWKIAAMLNHSQETGWHENLLKNYECIDTFFAKDYQRNTNSFITPEILCVQRSSFSDIEKTSYDYKEWMLGNFDKFKEKI